jgi:hypothetical protein
VRENKARFLDAVIARVAKPVFFASARVEKGEARSRLINLVTQTKASARPPE